MSKTDNKGFQKPPGRRQIPQTQQKKDDIPLDVLRDVGDADQQTTKEMVTGSSEKPEEAKTEKPKPRGRGAPKKNKADWVPTSIKLPKHVLYNLNLEKNRRKMLEDKAVPVEDLIWEALKTAGYDKKPE